MSLLANLQEFPPSMNVEKLLAAIVALSQRHARAVFVAGLILLGLSLEISAAHLGITTDANLLFSSELPWRQKAILLSREFPQFNDLLVVVIDARTPEEAEYTADTLAKALATDNAHFNSVRRPDAFPYLTREGLLFLSGKQLETELDGIIAAQPFLGALARDPSARGLFTTLSLLGTGVARGSANLDSFQPALRDFHAAMADAIDGNSRAFSWIGLLGGSLADLGGPYRFVLVQPTLDFGSLRPGGSATRAIREAAAQLEFVRSNDARVRITGPIALADDEFSTIAQGIEIGLIGSVLLITLWLFLAVRSWRLMVPILLTLGLGLALTFFFAAIAVGALNLVSVGFGILFVGIAVDFGIQFSVRFREVRTEIADRSAALTETGRRVGGQILVAALSTAAGFLAFVPTDFSGVAELGLIASAGMIIAFVCTLIYLPAAISLFRPAATKAEVGLRWSRPIDRAIYRRRWLVLAIFGLLGVLGLALLPRIEFDADPLDTKDSNTEAMHTLRDLMASPITNPFSIDVLSPSAVAAAALAPRLAELPSVAKVISINSFVPHDQKTKLEAIADAEAILGPTLNPNDLAVAPTPTQIRATARVAFDRLQPALPKLGKDDPLAKIAGDLGRLSNASDAVILRVNSALTRFLPLQLKRLRAALDARPVTLSDIPPELSRDWVLPDGRARTQVVPKETLLAGGGGLHRFVADVAAIAPDAGGAAVTIDATSITLVNAFRSAGITALATIMVILLVILRRPLDVALALIPVLLTVLLTTIVVVLLPLRLNYANIIALPLLLGVGVSFNIYFVMNWRAGRPDVLASATARAILFSALTTGTAFASLALSAHPGTASMGELLLISLGCTLLVSLVFVPALLGAVPRGPRK
jgi:uncharacterized protein